MNNLNTVSVPHDVGMYDEKMLYHYENILMGTKYVEYINTYSINKQSFLELGIGFGQTINDLSKNYDEFVTIDADLSLIERYKNDFGNIEFIHSFFEDYTPNRLFDNIGIGFVLDLVKDPVQLLKHYTSLLTHTGRIFVSIENASSLHRQVAVNAGILDNLKKMSQANAAFNHQFYNTYDEWLDIFKEAGLNVSVAHGLYLKPFSTKQIVSLHLEEKIYKSLADTAKDLPKISNACFFVLEK